MEKRSVGTKRLLDASSMREIGFHESSVKKAPIARKNNIERATEAIFNGELQPDGTGGSVVSWSRGGGSRGT